MAPENGERHPLDHPYVIDYLQRVSPFTQTGEQMAMDCKLLLAIIRKHRADMKARGIDVKAVVPGPGSSPYELVVIKDKDPDLNYTLTFNCDTFNVGKKGGYRE